MARSGWAALLLVAAAVRLSNYDVTSGARPGRGADQQADAELEE